jgi:thiol-disulfide isomerase/thioredoxin
MQTSMIAETPMANLKPVPHAFTLSTLLLAVGVEVSLGAAAELPRYRLAVGQEITYKGEGKFTYGNGTSITNMGDRSAWKVCVVGQNDNGSHRIVIQHTRTMLRDGHEQGSPDATLAYCDLFSDGRVASNESLGFRVDPAALFPRLPENQEQASNGWENTHGPDKTRSSYTVPSRPESAPGLWTIRESRTSPMNEIYLVTHKETAVFDAARGLITKTESESTQDYGLHSKGTSTVELASVEQHDADWAMHLGDEADRYFKAQKQYEAMLKRASKDAGASKALLDEAKHILVAANEAAHLPIIKEQLEAQLKNHDRMASYLTEEAVKQADLLGKPSALWETKDLEGKSHALNEYRGKVVILDFWYRGCGWCIRAMPQVKQLADDFRNQPVAVLGMNTDRNEEDAKFVVEKMSLTYPTLKATGLPEKYGVRGFPTLVIIDQEGKVHDFHVGYSPTLHDEVSQVIKELLAKK